LVGGHRVVGVVDQIIFFDADDIRHQVGETDLVGDRQDLGVLRFTDARKWSVV
jgi:hypothetical protein